MAGLFHRLLLKICFIDPTGWQPLATPRAFIKVPSLLVGHTLAKGHTLMISLQPVKLPSRTQLGNGPAIIKDTGLLHTYAR
jgi:hypothetical protein